MPAPGPARSRRPRRRVRAAPRRAARGARDPTAVSSSSLLVASVNVPTARAPSTHRGPLHLGQGSRRRRRSRGVAIEAQRPTYLVESPVPDELEPPAPTAFTAHADGPYAEHGKAMKRRVVGRSDSGLWLGAHLLTILAVAGALPALRAPVAWLVVCANGAVVMLLADAVSRRREEERRRLGSADVVVLPARAIGKVALGVLNPVTWLTVLLGGLIALVAGAVAAAAIGAVRWLVLEGPDGILAAIRTAAWAHTLTYASVAACFMLLRAGGRTAARRDAVLQRVTRRMPELAMTVGVVVLVGASVAFTFAGPRLDVPFVRSADGLGWLPPGLRATVDQGRDELVQQELDSVVDCLSGPDAGRWTARYTAGNA